MDDIQQANKEELQIQILKYFIKERLPLQKLESEHFNRLIECKSQVERNIIFVIYNNEKVGILLVQFVWIGRKKKMDRSPSVSFRERWPVKKSK